MQEHKFAVKDSGARAKFESGMVRDVEDDKADYTLILDGPMVERWAEHLTKGAKKYSPRNWMLASGGEEYERFRRSAVRHFFQWLRGEEDEDHAAAVFFNINGAEYVRNQTLAPESQTYTTEQIHEAVANVEPREGMHPMDIRYRFASQRPREG